MSAVTIDLPDSLHGKLREFAQGAGTSVELLLTAAASEKVAALSEGTAYLQNEAAQGSRADFERVLAKIPDVAPEDYDRLPPGNEI